LSAIFLEKFVRNSRVNLSENVSAEMEFRKIDPRATAVIIISFKFMMTAENFSGLMLKSMTPDLGYLAKLDTCRAISGSSQRAGFPNGLF
jgi:hypothetical protein